MTLHRRCLRRYCYVTVVRRLCCYVAVVCRHYVTVFVEAWSCRCRDVAVAHCVCRLRSSVVLAFVAMLPSLIAALSPSLHRRRSSSCSSFIVIVARCSVVVPFVATPQSLVIVFVARCLRRSLQRCHSLRRYTAVARHRVHRSLSLSLVRSVVIVATPPLLVVLFVARCHLRYVVVAIAETTTTLDLTPVFKRLLKWCDNLTPGKHLVSGSNDSLNSKDLNFLMKS